MVGCFAVLFRGCEERLTTKNFAANVSHIFLPLWLVRAGDNKSLMGAKTYPSARFIVPHLHSQYFVCQGIDLFLCVTGRHSGKNQYAPANG